MTEPPSLDQMMEKLQAAQSAMADARERLKSEIVEASSKGGEVTVRIGGDSRILGVAIDPAVGGDLTRLEIAIADAVNAALVQAAALADQQIGSIATGLGFGD